MQNRNTTSETRSRLQAEVRAICEILNGEDGFVSPPPSVAVLPGSIDIRFDEEMSPMDWMESPPRLFNISTDAQRSSLLPPHRWRVSRKSYMFTGLSPDCVHAYLLNKREISIHRLEPRATGPQKSPIFQRCTTESTFKKAAVSESFLAILKEGSVDSIDVYRYRHDNWWVRPTLRRHLIKPDGIQTVLPFMKALTVYG